MKDDRLYLVEMLELARRIQTRMARLNRAEFDANDDIQLALTHLLQMIGEAARGVSDQSRRGFSGVDWRAITGMRHRIVHDYMNVNVDVVWQTAKDDVPLLIAQLAPAVDPIIAQARKQKGNNP
jgi:uncharacterized protein with HEPN domain